MKSYLLMLLMAIFGSFCTICFSLQFSEKSLGKLYSHVWMQTHNTFLGEFLCLLVYFIMKLFNTSKKEDQEKEKEKGYDTKESDNLVDNERSERSEKGEPSIFIFILTSLCEFISSTLFGYALLNMPTSIYQMLRGGVVVLTSIFSSIFLNKVQSRHHVLGIFTVVASLVTIGISGIVNIEHHNTRRANFVEEILVILALFFVAIQYTIQEKILMDYEINPLKIVGLEGMWGLMLYSLFMPLLLFFRCDNYPWRTYICTSNERNEWRIEDNFFALQQIMNNNLLLFLVIIAILMVSFYNTLGVNVTKANSAPHRAIADNLKSILIWVFFISVPTNIEEQFFLMQFIGFCLMVLGTSIYNEFIEIPFCGLNLYTQKSLSNKLENMTDSKKDLENSSKESKESKEIKDTDEENKILLNN